MDCIGILDMSVSDITHARFTYPLSFLLFGTGDFTSTADLSALVLCLPAYSVLTNRPLSFPLLFLIMCAAYVVDY